MNLADHPDHVVREFVLSFLAMGVVVGLLLMVLL